MHRVRAESPRTLTTGSASAFAVMGLIWAKKSTLRSSRAAQGSPSKSPVPANDTWQTRGELFDSERSTTHKFMQQNAYISNLGLETPLMRPEWPSDVCVLPLLVGRSKRGAVAPVDAAAGRRVVVMMAADWWGTMEVLPRQPAGWVAEDEVDMHGGVPCEAPLHGSGAPPCG